MVRVVKKKNLLIFHAAFVHLASRPQVGNIILRVATEYP